MALICMIVLCLVCCILLGSWLVFYSILVPATQCWHPSALPTTHGTTWPSLCCCQPAGQGPCAPAAGCGVTWEEEAAWDQQHATECSWSSTSCSPQINSKITEYPVLKGTHKSHWDLRSTQNSNHILRAFSLYDGVWHIDVVYVARIRFTSYSCQHSLENLLVRMICFPQTGFQNCGLELDLECCTAWDK